MLKQRGLDCQECALSKLYNEGEALGNWWQWLWEADMRYPALPEQHEDGESMFSWSFLCTGYRLPSDWKLASSAMLMWHGAAVPLALYYLGCGRIVEKGPQ